MLGIAAAILLLLQATYAAGPSGSGKRSTIEGGKRVGTFELGKRFEPYGKVLGKPTKVAQSDVSDDARFLFYKQYGLMFKVVKGVVYGITVSSPLLGTIEGIRVGSTSSEVESAYGNPERVSDVYIRYPERGLAFSFEGGRVTNIFVVDKEARDLVAGDRRIVPGLRMGGLQLGQSADFVVKSWKNPGKRIPFSGKAGAEYWAYTNKGVGVVVDDGRVVAIYVFSKEYRTARDIHVGSPRDKVVRAYGRPAGRQGEGEVYPRQGLIFFYKNDAVVEINILDSEDKGGK